MQLAAVDLDRRVDRVARRAGDARRRSRARRRGSALTSEDLPTFGRPITREADDVLVLVVGVSSSSGSSSTRRSSRSPVPRPWAAETAIGSPSPSPWNSCASGRSLGRVDLVGGDDDRQRCRGAGCRRSPRRRGAGRRARRRRAARPAASASAARAWSWIETGQRVLVVEVDAAGVDQREAAAVPVASRAPCGRA